MAGLSILSSLGCILTHIYTEIFFFSRGLLFRLAEDRVGNLCLLPCRVVLPQRLVVVWESGGGGDVMVGGEVLWEGLPTGLGVVSGLVVGGEGGVGWVLVFVEALGDGLKTEDHGRWALIKT